MKYLTIIIPFLNEGVEIKNTLNSIRRFNKKIPIILVNDNSDDGYPYVEYSMEFGATYIRNRQRMGVAKSRDIGIARCLTRYFLLLDGHMRFYDSKWEEIICSELDKKSNTIICCQNIPLFKKGKKLFRSSVLGYGAKIQPINRGNGEFLNSKWIMNECSKGNETEEIPCILGAAYATSKAYWEELNGLTGLEQYGSDEIYISLKVWLSGGRCVLLKHVHVGHIYRTEFPYEVQSENLIYNILLIIGTIFPFRYFIYMSYILPLYITTTVYQDVFLKILRNSQLIMKLREYHKEIFVNDFSIIEALNGFEAITLNNHVSKNDLKMLYSELLDSLPSIEDKGLEGKMGILVFLLIYDNFFNESIDGELLNRLYEGIYNNFSEEILLDFDNALDVGWAMEYLFQNGFVKFIDYQLLNKIDLLISENAFSYLDHLSKISSYLVARASNTDFDPNQQLKKIIGSIGSLSPEKFSNPMSAVHLITKIRYYNLECSLGIKPSLLDILDFEKVKVDETSPSIFDGLSYIGINTILNQLNLDHL
ncbi:glycosyltransferase [Sphingobacterium sp.]|uniref:glycosyltransferase n=1 Tax=Sphingobacterium sp. TaxID=341027 RepID=UPI0031DA753D